MCKTLFQVATVIVLFCTTVVAQQQSSGRTDNGLGAAFSSTYSGGYPVTGIDTVNLYNGRVSLNLPLSKIGARGSVGYEPATSISRTFRLRSYQTWSLAGNPLTWSQPQFKVISEGYNDSYDYSNFQPGLLPAVIIGRRARDHNPNPSFTIPSSSSPCKTLTKLYLRMAGGEMELRDVGTNGNPYFNQSSAALNRGREWHAVDGSGMLFLSDSDIPDETCGDNSIQAMNGINMVFPTGYLMLQDGSRYRFVEGLPIWMRDRNGNTITFAGPVGSPEVTDSIGRKYQLSSGGVTYKDHSGADRTVAVISGNLSSALHSDFAAAGVKDLQTLVPGVVLESPTALFNPIVTTAVRLPNGLEYHFFYTEYAELARIEMPNGGVIEYDYGPGPGSTNGVLSDSGSPEVYRVATARRIYDSPGHLQTRQSFDYAPAVTTVKTYDAANLLVGNERHFFLGSVINDYHFTGWYQPFNNGREAAFEMLDASGNVLHRVDNTWETLDLNGTPTQPPSGTDATHQTNLNCALTAVKTTLSDTNQSAKTTFTYDGFGHKTDTYEYAFGSPGSGIPGGLVRRTHTDFDYDPSYVQSSGPRILNLISRQWVSSDADGSNKLAQTEFEYDNYTTDGRHAGLVNRANISGSCLKLNDNATSCLQASDSSYVKRGNLTQTTAYSDIPNSSAVITAVQYDIAGNAVKMIDARGNVTTFDYADSFGAPDGNARGNSNPEELSAAGKFSYAFPTLVSDAVGQRTFQYNYHVGKPVDVEDYNGIVTSFYNDDVLDRPTKIIRAANQNISVRSQTTSSYDDINRILTTTSDQNTFNDNAQKSQQLYDGLGRIIETRTYEGGNTYIAVQTEYDAMGRASKVSSPFRPWNSETAIWTTTGFDVRGRVISVTTPDGATTTTSYGGNTVTVTDQAGKKWRSLTDSLGRLVRVDEPDANGNLGDVSNPVQSTSYAYDILGNLRTVTQGSQQRFFMYDSLSRLIRARNPEQIVNANLSLTDAISGNSQWCIGYTYDDNGNLLTKTDARNITASYVYDALNRLTSRSYNDGTLPNLIDKTATVTYNYDSTIPNGNGKGRLASASSSVSSYSISGYDAMGRVRGGSQTIGSQTYTIGYSYDLAGHVKSMNYPSGKSVNYSYDAAGRLNDFRGNLGEATQQRIYATGITYDSTGGMTREQFGTDAPLYHKLRYNVRGQLFDIRLSSVNDTWDWNRGRLISYYTSSHIWGQSDPGNNGNVLFAENWIPPANATLDQAEFLMEHSYTYDALNRLSGVSESSLHIAGGGSWTPRFAQRYLYDRYGNRRIDTNPTQTWGGVNSLSFEVEAGTNRLYSPGDLALAEASRRMQYDSAGNLKKDTYTGAGDRVYDAENRMTKGWGGNNQWQEYTYNADGQRVRRKVDGTETWQVYGMGGELLAEYPANGAAASPQKEYGYRNGELLITATVSASGWGPPPAYTPPDLLVSGGEIKLEHLTELRSAVNQLRVKTGLSAFNFTVDPNPARNVTTIKAEHIRQLRTALEGARSQLQLSIGGYAHPTLTENSSWLYTIDFQELRNQILSAWNSGTGGVDIRWLMTDHLGTPRIIVDKTGALANVKRHDYVPFGEELFAGTGVRTAALGYGGDTVRQKFTSYERDNETGLDYAQARYYGSMMGRFSSPDPLHLSGKPALPQSWNRYSYSLNNPLAFVDPSGLIWGRVNGQGSPTWYKDQAAMEAANATAFTPPDNIYETEDGRFVALNPNGPGSRPPTDLAYSRSPDDLYYKSGWQYTYDPSKAPAPEQGLENKFDHLMLFTGVGQALVTTARTATNSAISRAFATEADQAVFWTRGEVAKDAATAFATTNGGRTITMTPGGQALSFLDAIPYQVTRPLWNFGSRKFAEGASGNVNVFFNGVAKPTSIWSRTELPTLLRNPNVTTIAPRSAP